MMLETRRREIQARIDERKRIPEAQAAGDLGSIKAAYQEKLTEAESLAADNLEHVRAEYR